MSHHLTNTIPASYASFEIVLAECARTPNASLLSKDRQDKLVCTLTRINLITAILCFFIVYLKIDIRVFLTFIMIV